MQHITILNSRVACKPLASRSIQKNDNGKGFVTAKEMTELLELEVVYSSLTAPGPGTKVYVRGDTKTCQWAKDVFELGGQKVIFVPLDQIQACSFEIPDSVTATLSVPQPQGMCRGMGE